MRTSALLLACLPALVASCHGPDAPAPRQRYTCAMHPQYVSDRPGDCPICGMRLVPIAGDGAGVRQGEASVRIDPERRRLVGLKTVPVRSVDFAGEIRTVGRIAVDERRVARVQPRFDGYIEKLEADFTGKLVKKGQRLASIYSPELLATEEELLLAARGREALAASGLRGAAEAPRARLRLLGVPDSQIDEIVRTGKPRRTLDVVAPISGVVTTKNAVAGARVLTDQPLFEIVDLRVVWLLADVYESDLPRVALGQPATATLTYWPGRTWTGRVSYVTPMVDDKTRTVKVRIELPNPLGELRPEMFADVVLVAPPHRALGVPEDAILDSGARKIAFVDVGDGRLEPREVEVGAHVKGLIEVRRGLLEGEPVATGASFLLDSESRLQAAVQSMGPPPVPARATPPSTPHAGHGGHP